MYYVTKFVPHTYVQLQIFKNTSLKHLIHYISWFLLHTVLHESVEFTGSALQWIAMSRHF